MVHAIRISYVIIGAHTNVIMDDIQLFLLYDCIFTIYTSELSIRPVVRAADWVYEHKQEFFGFVAV